ncbi:hypothetical protein HDU92_006033 [Lobulomyces angularis]|nr:hypothetical protein HDU92_006033 [Lobulomyces angularis]
MDVKLNTLKNLFLNAVRPCDAILLSGGLDTSIISDLYHTTIKNAITVLCSEKATDRYYSKEISKKYGFKHNIVEVNDCKGLLEDELLEFTIKNLSSFDPMEIRNSLVIAKGLIHAKNLGCKTVLLGDGADEIFIGYKFLEDLKGEKLKRWQQRMSKSMRFGSTKIGTILGLDIVQPFLNEDIINFSLQLEREDFVNYKDDDDAKEKLYGKFILRMCFPDTFSRWRDKDPIEVGSGSSELVSIAEKLIHKDEFLKEAKKILNEEKIVIRNSEHLLYYRVFKKVFSDKKSFESNNIWWKNVPVKRFSTDPCKDCGWQLENPEQYFCVVCGAWPARTQPIP